MIAIGVVDAALAAAPAGAQSAVWTIDPKTSLAWWQMNPHFNHLWATTCPNEPSWQPGEGRSPEYAFDADARPDKLYDAAHLETRIPLHPRKSVRPLCREAVRGEIVAADTVTWRGARGVITIAADSLVTGERMRDIYARKAVFQTNRHPEIRFTIDSVNGVQPADTVRGTAFGTVEVHGSRKAVAMPVRAWRHGDGWRVLGQFQVPADALVDDFNLSRMALGFGIAQRTWKTLHMGADVVLRRRSGP